MTELLLQYIWKFRLFDTKGLATTEGEAVEILKPGEQNLDSGADFSNARLKIGEMTWAGNVEIELQSTNWQKHGHSSDASHQNTLVLVCIEHNAKTPITIPVIELKGRIDHKYEATYSSMMQTEAFIPCQKFISNVDGFTVQSWLLRLLIERLEQKVQPVLASLQQNKNNWEETFYHTLAGNFGFNTNAVPFQLLSKSLPLVVLAKHKNSLLQLEALLLGQAGLLPTIENPDAYTDKLVQEYGFLARKYSLEPINPALWKFSKTRPANFPTMRIAQFAALVHTSSHLFSKILENRRPKQLQALLQIKASAYWDTHYRLGIETKNAANMLGDDAINNLLINTVAPFLFAYGHTQNDEDYKQKAIALLDLLPKENNRIIRSYQTLKIDPANAAETQGLLQMYKHWCMPKKCLQCSIGHKILNSKF
jgi:hypothetical protein